MRVVITFRPREDIGEYAPLIACAFASAKRLGYETVMVGPDDHGADYHLPHASDAPLMNWVLEAQLKFINSPLFSCEAVIFSPDALFVRDIRSVFYADFDVAFTDRANRRMPINNGVIFLKHLNKPRLVKFWEEALEICRGYAVDLQNWYGDQMALHDMMLAGRPAALNLKAHLLPCAIFNASLPKDTDVIDLRALSGLSVVHFKGKRKPLMQGFWRAML